MAALKTAWPLPVVALMIACLAGCGDSNDSATLVERARQHLAQGKTQAALIELKNAIQKDPENPDARFALGRLQLTLGEFASAEKELRHAKAAGYHAGRVNALLAQALLGQGEYDRLLKDIPASGQAAADVPVLVARARAQVATAAFPDAHASLMRALEVAPGDPEALLALAHLALAESKLSRAIEITDQLLRLSPRHRDAWTFKAQTLLAQNKPDEAISAYRQALDIDPGYHAARISLASLAIEQRQFDAARAEVGAVLKTSPNNLKARYTRARIAFEEGEYLAAREDLTAVLHTAPDFPPANLLAGSTDFALGKQQSAESHLKKALLAAPRDPRALRMLATVHLQQGRYAEARRSLDAIATQQHEASYHLIAGELALRLKQHEQAARHYAEAARLKPGNAVILTGLGLARQGMADPRAQSDLESAAALPGGGRAGAMLVLDQLHNKRFEQALASIAELEKRQGDSALLWNYRGVAFLGMKNPPRARDSFNQALKHDPTFYPATANLAQLDLRDKDPDAARRHFEDLLKSDPRHLNAMLALARLARDQAAATQWLRKAAETHPSAVEPRIGMARLLLANKRPSQALSQVREAIALAPYNPTVLDLLGAIQISLGDHTNAIGTLRKLAEVSPTPDIVLTRLARVQLAAGQTTEARRSLAEVLKSSPESLDALVLLTRLDLREARFDEARKRVMRIQTAHPRSALGFQLQGELALARKQPAEALAAYEQAQAVAPATETLIRQHGTLIQLGRRGESEARLTAWLQSRPGDLISRTTLAESLLHSGQFRAATAQYREINRRSPNNPAVLNNLAWALHAAGDPDALTFAEQAYKIRPDDASIMDTLGWILINRNQTARGLTILQQAQASAPDSADIQWHLASALAKTGDRTRARGELRRLLDSEADFSQRESARALLINLETDSR